MYLKRDKKIINTTLKVCKKIFWSSSRLWQRPDYKRCQNIKLSSNSVQCLALAKKNVAKKKIRPRRKYSLFGLLNSGGGDRKAEVIWRIFRQSLNKILLQKGRNGFSFLFISRIFCQSLNRILLNCPRKSHNGCGRSAFGTARAFDSFVIWIFIE